MSTGYQIYDQDGCYYLTFQIAGWADLFTRPDYRQILLDAFRFCIDEKGLRVHAYVVMSNHVHCILSARDANLSALVGSLKSWTAKKFWERLRTGPESRREWLQAVFQTAAAAHVRNSTYQIWNHDNHAVELRTDAFAKTRIDYIHYNPVRAGWVREPADWVWSSAADYYHNKAVGLLPIVPLL